MIADPVPSVSVGITLSRSARFLRSIIKNLEAIEYPNVEVLVSDCYGFDDTFSQLYGRYGGDHRFRFFKSTDQLNWIEHHNFLLRMASGKYFRWMPHDDSFIPCGLEELVARLETIPNAVLAYGPTEAVDLTGTALPHLNRLAPPPITDQDPWTVRVSLRLFWDGLFEGAFKGLFRRDQVMASELYIRSTYQQVYPERCWLFGMSLLGRFCFVPSSRYIKCYHPASTSAQWHIGLRHIVNNAYVMRGYLADLCPRRAQVWLGTGMLILWPWYWATRPYEFTPRGVFIRTMRDLGKVLTRRAELKLAIATFQKALARRTGRRHPTG